MTYVEIEEKHKELKELDDRYDEEDRVLEKWQIHDEIEYKIKYNFFLNRSNTSLLDTCDNFQKMVSFYGIIQLNDRVKMIEIRENKANEHLKQESIDNVGQQIDIDTLKQNDAFYRDEIASLKDDNASLKDDNAELKAELL